MSKQAALGVPKINVHNPLYHARTHATIVNRKKKDMSLLKESSLHAKTSPPQLDSIQAFHTQKRSETSS